jgi:hypothetical protein
MIPPEPTISLDWRDRGTVIREPDGPGRARTRSALRDPRMRAEGVDQQAVSAWHHSKFTKRPLGGRRADRRRRRRAARVQARKAAS